MEKESPKSVGVGQTRVEVVTQRPKSALSHRAGRSTNRREVCPNFRINRVSSKFMDGEVYQIWEIEREKNQKPACRRQPESPALVTGKESGDVKKNL